MQGVDFSQGVLEVQEDEAVGGLQGEVGGNVVGGAGGGVGSGVGSGVRECEGGDAERGHGERGGSVERGGVERGGGVRVIFKGGGPEEVGLPGGVVEEGEGYVGVGIARERGSGHGVGLGGVRGVSKEADKG